MQVERDGGAAEAVDERRGWQRVPSLQVARVGPPGCRPEQCRGALIEDRSTTGVGLRCGMPVRPGDRVVLFVGDERLSAEVVWARPQGVLVDDRSGKPGRAFVAGCRIRTLRERFSLTRWLRSRSWPDVAARLVRGAVLLAGLGAAGVMLYWAVCLLRLLR